MKTKKTKPKEEEGHCHQHLSLPPLFPAGGGEGRKEEEGVEVRWG